MCEIMRLYVTILDCDPRETQPNKCPGLKHGETASKRNRLLKKHTEHAEQERDRQGGRLSKATIIRDREQKTKSEQHFGSRTAGNHPRKPKNKTAAETDPRPERAPD